MRDNGKYKRQNFYSREEEPVGDNLGRIGMVLD